MGTDSLSTMMAARHRRSELNHRSVLNRARGRHVSTLATIDDTADLERGPDGTPLRHDRDHVPRLARPMNARFFFGSVQNVLNDVCDLRSKAAMRNQIRNLMPSAAEQHGAGSSASVFGIAP